MIDFFLPDFMCIYYIYIYVARMFSLTGYISHFILYSDSLFPLFLSARTHFWICWYVKQLRKVTSLQEEAQHHDIWRTEKCSFLAQTSRGFNSLEFFVELFESSRLYIVDNCYSYWVLELTKKFECEEKVMPG